MEQEVREISKYRALVDTSSVVAHDLCAQLHVLQFCVEELSHHVNEEGSEFLEKMGDSTQYIASLVDTFRKHLKITLNDEDPTSLDKIYQASLELVKNHFFVILESIDFKVATDLETIVAKNEARKLMNIIFSLYSMALEKIKGSDCLGKENISVEFHAVKINNRFAEINVSFNGFDLSSAWLFGELESSTPEKGRLRKFLGQRSIKEQIAEDNQFLNFRQTSKGSLISLKIPLRNQ